MTWQEQLIKENCLPKPPEPTPNTIDHARWRDIVNRWVEPDVPAMYAALAKLERDFARYIPKFPDGDFTVFVDINKAEAVELVLRTLAAHFRVTLEHCVQNMRRMGVAEKSILPSDYKGDPLLYLQGTPLLELFTTTARFALPEEQRFSGMWICSPPGRGKTVLLQALVLQDLSTQASVIMMDSKGDLIEPFRHFRSIKNSLVTIEPSLEHPLALNPFDLGRKDHTAVGLLEYIFSALLPTGSQLTALQSTLFRCAIRATLCYPSPTIETFREIIQNGVPEEITLPFELRTFFRNEFPDSKTYGETRKQIQWRLRLLMENPIVSAMFSAPKTKLNLPLEMANGKIIIIDASRDKLGKDGSRFFQRLIIALVLQAAQQRASLQPYQKRPCFFYIDECASCIAEDENIAEILDTCRSQRIALILAHQRLQQITSPNVRDALQNCAIRFANSDDDATALAPKLRTTPEALRQPVGHFAVYIRDMGAYTVKVPNYPLSELPQMNPQERAEHHARMIESYCIDPPPLVKFTWGKGTSQQVPEHTDTNTDDTKMDTGKDW